MAAAAALGTSGSRRLRPRAGRPPVFSDRLPAVPMADVPPHSAGGWLYIYPCPTSGIPPPLLLSALLAFPSPSLRPPSAQALWINTSDEKVISKCRVAASKDLVRSVAGRVFPVRTLRGLMGAGGVSVVENLSPPTPPAGGSTVFSTGLCVLRRPCLMLFSPRFPCPPSPLRPPRGLFLAVLRRVRPVPVDGRWRASI